MGVLVRRYEGADITITAADLAKLGLKPGQFVAIRALQPLPLIEPRPDNEASRARRRDLAGLWQNATMAEEIDAECAHEEIWQQWSQDQE